MSNIIDGKHKFKIIIKYINENKINLTQTIKDNISKLILQWNIKDKNFDDYNKMKEYHSNINGQFEDNQTLSDMWLDYIQTTQRYRIDQMSKLNTTTNINVYIDNHAKKIFSGITEGKSMITSQTINDNEHIKLITITYKNIIVSYALLSKNDYDPYNEYSNPYTLDYIYSLEKYRRHGFASLILNYIKTHEEVTAFCDDKGTERLFKKLGYRYYGLDKILKMLPVYRCPV